MHAHTNKECNKIISDTSKTFLSALVTGVVPPLKLDLQISKLIFSSVFDELFNFLNSLIARCEFPFGFLILLVC